MNFTLVTPVDDSVVWAPGAGYVYRYQLPDLLKATLYDHKMVLRQLVKLTGTVALSNFGNVTLDYAIDGVQAGSIPLLSGVTLEAGQTSTKHLICVEFPMSGITRLDYRITAGNAAAGTFTVSLLEADENVVATLKTSLNGVVQVTDVDYQINGTVFQATASTRFLDLLGKLDRRVYDPNASVEALWDKRVESMEWFRELMCTYQTWGASALPASTPILKKYTDIKASLSICWLSAVDEWLYNDGPMAGVSSDDIVTIIRYLKEDLEHLGNGFVLNEDVGEALYKGQGTFAK
jgi:hypothetical protein